MLIFKQAVLNPMPPFEMEGRESSLLSLAAGSSHNRYVDAIFQPVFALNLPVRA